MPKINLDELNWSDEEEEKAENRYIPIYPVGSAKMSLKSTSLSSKTPTKPSLAPVYNPPNAERKKDYKRSFFSGNIKICEPMTIEDVQKSIEEEKWRTNIATISSVRPNALSNKSHRDPNLPYVPDHVLDTLGDAFVTKFWYECCVNKCNADKSTGLVQVKYIKSTIYAWVKANSSLDIPKDTWMSLENAYDKTDFVEFTQIVELMQHSRSDRVASIYLPEKREVDQDDPRNIKTCCCAFDACEHQLVLKEKASLLTVDYEDFDETEEFSKPEIFRATILFEQYKSKFQGKVRLKHALAIMKEMGLKANLLNVPQDLWENQQDFFLSSVKSLLQLIGKLRVVEYDEFHGLDHLFRYPLPHWLKMEFKLSEIMLYQYHFSLIDVDAGGDIDSEELKQLLSQFGKDVTLEEAKTILDTYDLDGGGTLDFTEFMVLIYRIQRGTIEVSGNDLAEALLDAKSQLNIFEEISEISVKSPDNTAVVSFAGNPIVCKFLITGPEDSFYAGKSISMEMTFRVGYPFLAPEILFTQRVVGINFIGQIDGCSRLMHLQENWDATWSIKRTLEHVVDILREPDIKLVPMRFLSIYYDWESSLSQILAKQEGKAGKQLSAGHAESKDDARSANSSAGEYKGKKLIMTDLSPPTTMEKIKKLSRVEQMHLAVLFMYLTERKAFEHYVKSWTGSS